MKKRLILIALFAAAFFPVLTAHAQGAEQVLQQKKTQKKYLLRQIAALQVYIKFLQKGYGIAKDGLTLIGDIRDGEFGLHKDYFRSLDNLSPTVRNYGKVASLVSLQKRIADVSRDSRRKAQASEVFTAEELRYIRRVHDRLLGDCSHTLDGLLAVTTDSKLQLTDSERMSRIDGLYARMQGQYAFLRSFNDETKALAASRTKTQNDVKTGRKLNGLTNRQP